MAVRNAIMANEKQFKLLTKYIATRGVDEYRQTVRVLVKPDDAVLEIGCEKGTTSDILSRATKHLIATDISDDCVAMARERYPHIRFEALDAFDIRSAMRLGAHFDKVYIDMSGLSSYRALLDVIALITMYASVFEPDAIIVKSGSLKQFAKNCEAWKWHSQSAEPE